MDVLFHADVGQIDFPAAVALQEDLARRRAAGELGDVILFVEHPHLYTLGQSAKDRHLLNPKEVPVYRAWRGGDVTYHGPGQLIVYPIIHLNSKLRKAVHRYLKNLENAAIDTLADFDLLAKRTPPWSGVWIERRKIAAVGIAVRKGITRHGIALNVTTDLSYFDRIVPCGLAWAETTSIEREKGKAPALKEIKRSFLQNFAAGFNYQNFEELCLEDIPTGSRCASPAAHVTASSSAS
jgi:lipoyl(octanoyl) transferase